MSLESPQLTVGISCYNEGPLLREAFNSVVAQSFTDWECIIVNDASDDELTLNLCKELAEHPQVRFVLRESNGGLSASRNTAVEHARSPIMVTLDADDLLPPDALIHVAKTFMEHPEAAYVYGNYESFGDWIYTQKAAEDLNCIVTKAPFNGHSPYRISTWEAVGGFCDELSYGMQDWDFWMSIIERDLPGVYIDESLYQYRAREGTMSRRRGPRYPAIYEYMYSKHKAYIDAQGLGRKFLAPGYHKGAQAVLFEGKSIQAFRWAWASLRWGHRVRANLRIMAMAFLPRRKNSS